jgi:hypothetical protein
MTTVAGNTWKGSPIKYAKGSHQNPLSRDELWLKFADCLGVDFPESAKVRIFESLMRFDSLHGPNDLGLKYQ